MSLIFADEKTASERCGNLLRVAEVMNAISLVIEVILSGLLCPIETDPLFGWLPPRQSLCSVLLT